LHADENAGYLGPWGRACGIPRRPATTLEDNLQSTAMLFAAVRASETGTTVDDQELGGTLES
jgi:hypothetical protein